MLRLADELAVAPGVTLALRSSARSTADALSHVVELAIAPAAELKNLRNQFRDLEAAVPADLAVRGHNHGATVEGCRTSTYVQCAAVSHAEE
jgi:hypothetical protein